MQDQTQFDANINHILLFFDRKSRKKQKQKVDTYIEDRVEDMIETQAKQQWSNRNVTKYTVYIRPRWRRGRGERGKKEINVKRKTAAKCL